MQAPWRSGAAGAPGAEGGARLRRDAIALAAPPRLAPGAQLVREWNGRTYRVEVVAEGFRMDGRVYASLSAVAKRITGATWSGPRFFGLVTRAGG